MFTGSEIGMIKTSSSVRTCNFSYSANMASYSTDTTMKQLCEIFIIDVRNADNSIGMYIRILIITKRI